VFFGFGENEEKYSEGNFFLVYLANKTYLCPFILLSKRHDKTK